MWSFSSSDSLSRKCSGMLRCSAGWISANFGDGSQSTSGKSYGLIPSKQRFVDLLEQLDTVTIAGLCYQATDQVLHCLGIIFDAPDFGAVDLADFEIFHCRCSCRVSGNSLRN